MNGFTSLVRKVLISGMAALALVVQFGGAPEPALAGRGSYVVDDAGVDCLRGGPAYTSIQDAIWDAETFGVNTILICPGTYSELVSISGVDNLTVKAAMPEQTTNWPVLTGVACDCGGTMFIIEYSTRVTVDSLKLVGGWDDGTVIPMSGFLILHADVVLQNISITNIRTPTISAASEAGYGVWINDAGVGGRHTVKLLRVNITDYQTAGVFATGPVALTISESHIDGENNTGILRDYGVFLKGGAIGLPSGTIARNIIVGIDGTAIQLNEVNKVSVTGNFMTDSIAIQTNCSFPGATANGHKVSGNTVAGGTLQVQAAIDVDTAPGCNPTANNTLFSNNIVSANAAGSGYGVLLFADLPSGGHTAFLEGTKVTGNTFYGYCCTTFLFGAASPPTEGKNAIVP